MAEAAVIEQLLIGIGVDTQALNKGLSTAQGMVGQSANALRSMLAPLTAALSFGAAFNSWLQGGEALGKLAQNTGESAKNLDAWGQAVANAGGSAEAFQGTVNNLYKQLSSATAVGNSSIVPFLNQVGVSAVDASGKARKATDVITDVAKAMDKYTPDQRNFLLQKSGFDEGTIQLLRKGSAEVNAILERTRKNAMSDQDAKDAMEFKRSIQEVGFAVRALAAQFMRLFTPALKSIAEGMENSIHWMREHSEVVIPALISLGGVLAYVIGKQIVGAILRMNAAMIANPIGLIIAGITLLLTFLDDIYVWFKGGDSMFGEFYDKFAGVFKLIGASVKNFVDMLDGIWDSIKMWADGVKDVFSGIFDLDIDKVLEGIKKIFSAIINLIKSLIKGMWGGIGISAKGVFDGIKGLLGIGGNNGDIQPANAIQGGGAVSNAVSNNSSNTNAQIGSIVIQTNATDAQGIAHDAYSAFYDEFELAYAYQSGVNYK